MVNSTQTKIKLSGEKIKQIRQDTRKSLEIHTPQALALSRLLGKLNHVAQAIPPAPLFYRNLQLCLQRTLERTAGGRDYSAYAHLTPQELEWWQTHLTRWNDRRLLIATPDVVIETDATRGWEVPVKGGEQEGHGQRQRARCI